MGVFAGASVTDAVNVICIGAEGANITNSCFIGNIYNSAVPGGQGVVIGSDGRLGLDVSARRFKKEIKPMDKASEAVLSLKPVTFQYKSDVSGASRFGLIAEDVTKVNPDLVTRDKDGQILGVRYDAVKAMLLNEFLKEHRKVQELYASDAEQKKEIAEQRKEIHALTAALKEQAEQIQRVSAKVGMTRPADQIVVNNQ